MMRLFSSHKASTIVELVIAMLITGIVLLILLRGMGWVDNLISGYLRDQHKNFHICLAQRNHQQIFENTEDRVNEFKACFNLAKQRNEIFVLKVSVDSLISNHIIWLSTEELNDISNYED